MDALTAGNAAVLFLDLQDGIVSSSNTVSKRDFKRNAGALAQLAALHTLPAFLSAVPPGGEYFDAVLDPLGRPEPRNRTYTTAFADAGLVDAIRTCGRNVLVLAGVASEIVVQRTALDALAAGFSVQIAVDACGGAHERTEQAAWLRLVQAGAVLTSVTTIAAELAGDFTSDTGAETFQIMQSTLA